MSGAIAIVGLGPGPAEWMTPEASAAIEAASDLVGYRPYIERLTPKRRTAPPRERQSRRARPRAGRAGAGRGGPRGRGRVGRRSRRVRHGGGGVRGGRGKARNGWRSMSRSCPASRRCRRRRPGSARRSATISAPSRSPTTSSPGRSSSGGCDAPADGDFVIALYNPASKARPAPHLRMFRSVARGQERRDAGRLRPRRRPRRRKADADHARRSRPEPRRHGDAGHRRLQRDALHRARGRAGPGC